MAVKTFNYTNDRYIEGADTRAQIAALLRNDGYGFKGNINRVGSTNTYTVAAGSVIFVGGLCVRILTDEAFDLTSNRYIVVETSYTSLTDGYVCVLKAVNTVETSLQGDVKKHYPIYDKTIGVLNSLVTPEDLSAQMADLANLASLNNNGWFKDKKTGLIIQWGKIVKDINNGIVDVQVFFPIAFPNKCTYVGVNAEETSGGGDASLNVTRNLNANAESIGLNAFNIRCKNVVNTYGAQATFRWFAIGY